MVYPITKRTIGFYFRLYIKKVNGLENLPEDIPFILASNQESNIDPFLLFPILSKINKKIYFITRFTLSKKYDFLTKFTLFITRPLLVYWLGCLPVLKKGGTIEASISLLKKGKIIGIFPEGKRNKKSTLLNAKTGIARMALSAKVPVIPAGIINSYKILPIGSLVPRFRRAVINIGKPMFFQEYYGLENDKKILRKVTGKIMIEIGKLCGKKYQGVY